MRNSEEGAGYRGQVTEEGEDDIYSSRLFPIPYHLCSRFVLIALAYLGFISLGLPDGLLGVAWPSMRMSFALPLEALGSLLVAFTAGYVLSSFCSGFLLSRIGVGTLLALSCLTTAVSLLGYAFSPFWWLLVAFGILAGLGAGAIDTGINTYAATYFSTRMVNWLHASYGVGAALGPVLMTSILMTGSPWQCGYIVVGGGQMILSACFALTRRQWLTTTRPALAAESLVYASTWSTLRLHRVRLSILLFFLYTGIEAAFGAWTYSLLTQARGIPINTAGTWVSLYWGSLAVGRIVLGFIVDIISIQRFLYLCIGGVTVGATLLWLGRTDFLGGVGLVLAGFAAGPIFPSLIATTPLRLGETHTANGVGFQIAAASLGQALLPALIGVAVAHWGLEMIASILLTGTVMLLGVYVLLETSTAVFVAPP